MQERQLIKDSILSHVHIVLVAPRSYAKTSLITEVRRENSFPGQAIDFFFVLNQQDVCHQIELAISNLLNQLLANGHGTFDKVVQYFKKPNPIDDDVSAEILFLTQNHPYYVNALCRRILRQAKPPTLATSNQTWQQFVSQQSPWIISELMKLTLNRNKVLTALADQVTTELQSRAF